MSLTSHLKSLLTKTEGGGGSTCLVRGSLVTGSSSETWKTGYTYMVAGSSSIYASLKTCWII